MRRKDREITDFNEIVAVLDRCNTIHLGIKDAEYPYVVPLSFGYEVQEGQLILYFHGAQEGKKHDLLRTDQRVCVEADTCGGFVDTNHSITAEYESIIGYGCATPVTGCEAEHGMELLLRHCEFPDYPYDHAVFAHMTVYRITLDSVTGKRRTVNPVQ